MHKNGNEHKYYMICMEHGTPEDKEGSPVFFSIYNDFKYTEMLTNFDFYVNIYNINKKGDFYMEENSKETTINENTFKATKNGLIGVIVVLAIILLIVVIVFGIFVGRSAKSTVKDVAKVAKKADIVGAVDLVDPIGIVAFVSCYDYEDNKIDFENFEDNYEKIEKSYKKIKDEIKKGKYTIEVTDTEKVEDAKKITKVTCNIKIKYEKNEIKLKNIKVYTRKDGLKNYIIGIDPDSIEKAEDQLYDQEDELENIAEELEDKLEDAFEDMEDIMDL